MGWRNNTENFLLSLSGSDLSLIVIQIYIVLFCKHFNLEEITMKM